MEGVLPNRSLSGDRSHTERFLTIEVEKIGRVAHLTLSRPERANALNDAMLSEIGTALDKIERDSGVRVLIVADAGTAFSSGFDLKEQIQRRPVVIPFGVRETKKAHFMKRLLVRPVISKLTSRRQRPS